MGRNSAERARAGRLRRQAYLLTGDPVRAESLVRRARAAAGPDRGGADPAFAELVRVFVADPPPETAPEVRADGNAAVWEALKGLPPRRRAVLVLRYGEGLSEQETADRLGSSADAVAADADAGLLTLRTWLGRDGDPAEAVPAALAAAARDPAATRPLRRAPRPAGRPAGPRHGRAVAPAGGRSRFVPAVAVVVVLAASAVVALVRPWEADAPDAPPAGTVAGSVADPADRLLDWPARGPAANASVLRAAVAAWRSGAAAGTEPTGAATLLYGGPLDGRQVAVLQAVDPAGRPWVAQVDGGTGYVGAQQLPPGTAVLSIVPPRGRPGPVRVLVAPAAGTEGLLAADAAAVVTAPASLDADGVSGPLPASGRPAASTVVVLGAAAGDGGRAVLVRATVRADRLVPVPAR